MSAAASLLLEDPGHVLEVESADIVYPLVANENHLPLARLGFIPVVCGDSISFTTTEKLDALRAVCAKYASKKETHRPHKTIIDAWDKPVYWGSAINPNTNKQALRRAVKMERCYAELVDPAKTLPPNPTKFDPTQFTVLRLPWVPEHPKFLAAPPPPLNAEHYSTFNIPNTRKTTAAKTESGLKRFQAVMDEIYRERREQYAQQPDVSISPQGVNTKLIDRRDVCRRCGCTVFVPVRDSKNRLKCYDCGKRFWESVPEKDETKYDEGIHQISHDNLRETTRDVPNDENRRAEYQEKYRHVIPYNPLGRGRTEAAEHAVRNHRDFLVDAARNEIQLTNTPIVALAEQMGVNYDRLRQRLSRGNQDLDLYKTDPNTAVIRETLGNHKVPVGFNIAVRLNNRMEIKCLGALNDSPQQNLFALRRLKKASVKDALKYERKKARKNGWNSEQLAAAEQAARARVEEAYRLPFESLQSEIEGEGGTLSQFPHKVEGKAVQVRPQPHAGTI